ncbi:citrulline utilization hydrolase CtlX [Rufibacter latericius]|uniref:Amidinotransferase n=1 Tax=Rufibacter latericius TaxID=2487040 RepID=A0A3M9N0B9_9BACT|nr:arginine deiminase-related protein [Rufibacter latericius]RNI31166.1 amidinotransferase [Rufibacter latericius]
METENKLPAHANVPLANKVLLVRPTRFGSNPETAATNSFQQEVPAGAAAQVQQKALDEFNQFLLKLWAARIDAVVLDDVEDPATPDAVFPNNWISFHKGGKVVLYPMLSPTRRLERHPDLLTQLQEEHGLVFKEVIDLTPFENEGKFLEGTGSLVLDRQHKIAYACLSERTHLEPLQAFCEKLDFRPVVFHAVDANNLPIYHTNVIMSIGADFALVCLEAIPDEEEQGLLLEALVDTGKEIIDLSLAQVKKMAGNMLQVRNKAGEPVLVMSDKGYKALRKDQFEALNQLTKMVRSDLRTIEAHGGGSARCMLAEIFV